MKYLFAKENRTYALGFLLIVSLIGLVIFWKLYWHSDIDDHAEFVKNYMLGNAPLPDNFLYYWIVMIFSFGKQQFLMYSSIGVLTIALLLKYVITVEYFKYDKNNLYPASILAFILILTGSIYLPNLLFLGTKNYLYGTFPPNVWHNSTTIALMPFAILLFLQTMKQIKEYSHKRLAVIIILNEYSLYYLK